MPVENQINDFVVAGLGVATVFAALICIIFICNIMGAIFQRINQNKKDGSIGIKPIVENARTAPPAPAAEQYLPAQIQNRGEVIAAVSAAIAEDCKTDISRIRILSVKQRADAISNRAELCAAIGAAISEETGAARVRIHSIKKV